MTPDGKEGLARSAAALVLGAVAVAVVAMLIVPLPTWLVDVLITGNLAVSLLLLLGAAYARDPLSLASFPALLVVTTLFRLALNVSTVRLILLQADAGRVVRAFGSFVVRGDYVVGLAVFLLLAIVQYVVIARGAERVAEVAARFTLDAMPGKQLAIDADLRAGLLSASEARRQRAALAHEARLYGSLDGAMRFVKGDAVAGLLILAVSLIGGLVVGTLRHGMSLGHAAELYTLLTVGDGLAAQIPALLIATGAGLLVTHVGPRPDESGQGGTHEALRAFFERPWALLLVAGLLAVLAVLPGLPLVPFAVVALVLALAALLLLRRGERTAVVVEARLPPETPPLELVLSPELAALPRLADAVEDAVHRVTLALGVPLPPVSLRPRSRPASMDGQRADDTSRSYTLRLYGASVLDGMLPSSPSPKDAEDLGVQVEAALRRHAHQLLGLDETQRLLDRLALRHPALVRAVVPGRVELATLTEVLRRLVAEGVPLGDLRDLLEALAALPAEADRDPARLTERLRRALGRHITAPLLRDRRLPVLVLDPLVEEALHDAVRATARGADTLALDPALADDILAALERELRACADRDGIVAPALVTTAELRRHLRRLVAETHPRLTVLGWPELAPDLEVHTVGRVSAA